MQASQLRPARAAVVIAVVLGCMYLFTGSSTGQYLTARSSTPEIFNQAAMDAFVAAKRGQKYEYVLHALAEHHNTTGRQPRFVQIGAHTASTDNDPIDQTMRKYGWKGLLVEPAPHVFPLLQAYWKPFVERGERVLENAAICPVTQKVDFYTLSKDIDVVTGFDSRTNKTVKAWVSQLSSTNYQSFIRHAEPFTAVGLNVTDYIETHTVDCYSPTDLLKRHPEFSRPDLMLIDTEGLDAEIVHMLDLNAMRPDVIVFEVRWISQQAQQDALKLLSGYGYKWVHENNGDPNVWCYRG